MSRSERYLIALSVEEKATWMVEAASRGVSLADLIRLSVSTSLAGRHEDRTAPGAPVEAAKPVAKRDAAPAVECRHGLASCRVCGVG
jgi:hypothetical protein